MLLVWMTGWLIHWSIDWSTDWLIDWLIHLFINWLIDWSIDRLIHWLINNELRYLTGSVATDAAGSTARCGEVALGGTVQRERSWIHYGDRTSSGDDNPFSVSPHVTRLRKTVRLTRQHVTRAEWRPSRWSDGHWTRTIYKYQRAFGQSFKIKDSEFTNVSRAVQSSCWTYLYRSRTI